MQRRLLVTAGQRLRAAKCSKIEHPLFDIVLLYLELNPLSLLRYILYLTMTVPGSTSSRPILPTARLVYLAYDLPDQDLSLLRFISKGLTLHASRSSANPRFQMH